LYHAHEGAQSEARVKFIQPGRLQERLQHGPVRILDVGFGLGINSLEAIAVSGPHSLHIDSLEIEEESLDRALLVSPAHPVLTEIKATGSWQSSSRSIRLHFGDLRDTLPRLTEPYDLIFHDPFRPLRNTEAWTVEVFQQLARLLTPEGCLLTYSQSKIVRAGLAEAGFLLYDTPESPPHRGGTAATQTRIAFEPGCPIPDQSWGIPWRDPEGSASGTDIRSRREKEVRTRAGTID
jgi:tRNA U34 5-methylaminomethyl-2-thiouridine-forming methyltransferase MnmC